MASSLDKLFLFGDQTVDLLPTILYLNRLVSRSENLKTFFQKSVGRLHAAISTQTPPRFKRRFPPFVSLPELAAAVEEGAGEGQHEPALRAALLCTAQLGHVIMYECPSRARDSN